ncbi:hypothetical protein STAS_11037, partial [Striga asiatica]
MPFAPSFIVLLPTIPLLLHLQFLQRLRSLTATGHRILPSSTRRLSTCQAATTRPLPSEFRYKIRRKIAELEKKRKTRNPRKNKLLVDVPESKNFLYTATMPMILIVVGTALFAKLLMMLCQIYFLPYDGTTKHERIERKIKETPGLGSVRMLTHAIQEVRPRTPFESKIARPNAKIRTGEPLHR